MVNHLKNRYLILSASVFLQFCYGLAYVWSVFQPYAKERYKMDTGSANMPFGVLLAAFSLGNVAGGLLQKRIKPRFLVSIGNVLLILGFLLTAFVPFDKGYLLNVTYGILGGFGGGMAYNTTIATVQKWFPDKRGLVTGILICATGSFGLVMNPVAQKMLQTYGYQGGTLAVTGIITLCLLLGTAFIRKPDETDRPAKEQNTVEDNYTIKEVLSTPQYYLITLSMMLAVPGYFLINPMLMSLGAEKGLSADMALAGVMFVAVMNTSGRLLAPWVSDRLGRKGIMIGLFLINIISVLAVLFFNQFAFMIAIGMVGFTYGGFMGMYPTLTADYFGSMNNGINYGAVMIGYGMSSLGCPYLVKAVQASTMGTLLSLIIAAGASVVGIIILAILKKPERQTMPQTQAAA